MKGIILAGGHGTRLWPLTWVTSKQLLPLYDKPIIYYPLSTLISAGTSEVLLISTPSQLPFFKQILGDGKRFGIKITYEFQEKPEGIPQGIKIAEKFLNNDPFWFILGDNFFHGPDFGRKLSTTPNKFGVTVFAHKVKNPEDYGVVAFDAAEENIRFLVEKPKTAVSNWAIPGLYFFDNSACSKVYELKKSARNEYEILDLLSLYLKKNMLHVVKTSRGNVWYDLGTADQLLDAANYVKAIQERQGLLIGSPEDTALNQNLKPIDQFDYQNYLGSSYVRNLLYNQSNSNLNDDNY